MVNFPNKPRLSALCNSRSWLSAANVWTVACLAITAIACSWVATRPEPSSVVDSPLELTETVAGELTIAPVDERIELAQVGTAVWSYNPGEEDDLEFGNKVDPATWKHLVLRSHKSDGSACEINLLRPDWWVELEAAQQGGKVYVSVPECGIDGDAEVLYVRPCPPVQECPPGYHTITGTFYHKNASIIDLFIEGLNEPIGTTPNHMFWSEDRREFIAASELYINEKLLCVGPRPRLLAKSLRSTKHDVYNCEVHCKHAYHVSNIGVLVHNAASCRITIEYIQGWDRRDFSRKVRALEDLAARRKLVKAANPVARDKAITAAYKNNLIRRAYNKFAKSDPETFKRLRQKILDMHPDHVHELQLLGADELTNLSLLDPDVNTGIGRQIWNQIRDLDDGTIIDGIDVIGF